MHQFRPEWLAEQQRRFTRPDGQRYIRPDAERYIRHDAWRFMAPNAPRYTGKDVVRYFWPDPEAEKAAQPHEREEEQQDFSAELRELRSELAAIKAANSNFAACCASRGFCASSGFWTP
jgi:hypothetical protein